MVFSTGNRHLDNSFSFDEGSVDRANSSNLVTFNSPPCFAAQSKSYSVLWLVLVVSMDLLLGQAVQLWVGFALAKTMNTLLTGPNSFSSTKKYLKMACVNLHKTQGLWKLQRWRSDVAGQMGHQALLSIMVQHGTIAAEKFVWTNCIVSSCPAPCLNEPNSHVLQSTADFSIRLFLPVGKAMGLSGWG